MGGKEVDGATQRDSSLQQGVEAGAKQEQE